MFFFWAELQESRIANQIFMYLRIMGLVAGTKLGLARLEGNVLGRSPHDSTEVIKFCIGKDITPCGLPSHTSHKLQPCDAGVFAPLKTAYCGEVERLMTITHLPVSVCIL